MAGNNDMVDKFYSAAISACANISPQYERNTMRDTTPPMYLTRTGIRLKSSTLARNLASARWLHSGSVTNIGFAQVVDLVGIIECESSSHTSNNCCPWEWTARRRSGMLAGATGLQPAASC